MKGPSLKSILIWALGFHLVTLSVAYAEPTQVEQRLTRILEETNVLPDIQARYLQEPYPYQDWQTHSVSAEEACPKNTCREIPFKYLSDEAVHEYLKRKFGGSPGWTPELQTKAFKFIRDVEKTSLDPEPEINQFENKTTWVKSEYGEWPEVVHNAFGYPEISHRKMHIEGFTPPFYFLSRTGGGNNWILLGMDSGGKVFVQKTTTTSGAGSTGWEKAFLDKPVTESSYLVKAYNGSHTGFREFIPYVANLDNVIQELNRRYKKNPSFANLLNVVRIVRLSRALAKDFRAKSIPLGHDFKLNEVLIYKTETGYGIKMTDFETTRNNEKRPATRSLMRREVGRYYRLTNASGDLPLCQRAFLKMVLRVVP